MIHARQQTVRKWSLSVKIGIPALCSRLKSASVELLQCFKKVTGKDQAALRHQTADVSQGLGSIHALCLSLYPPAPSGHPAVLPRFTPRKQSRRMSSSTVSR